MRPTTDMPRIQERKFRVVEPFNEFLKTLRKPAAQDINSHLKMSVDVDSSISWQVFPLQISEDNPWKSVSLHSGQAGRDCAGVLCGKFWFLMTMYHTMSNVSFLEYGWTAANASLLPQHIRRTAGRYDGWHREAFDDKCLPIVSGEWVEMIMITIYFLDQCL